MAHIVLKDVSLDIPLYGAYAGSLQRRVLRRFIPASRHGSQVSFVSALSKIDVDLRVGDRVGLVGLNGAGKSTFLKVLAGIYVPTSGRVDVSGTIATLFDLYLGTDEDLSGLENLYIFGYMLGLSRAEIEARLPEIVAFTELGEDLMRPVRTYSLGMRVRLAFAMATSFDSDITLIDEILGVGDAKFLKRASARLRDRVDKSSIVVIASHADAVLRDFCDKGLVFHRGRLVFAGGLGAALELYRSRYVNAG